MMKMQSHVGGLLYVKKRKNKKQKFINDWKLN